MYKVNEGATEDTIQAVNFYCRYTEFCNMSVI